MAISFKRLEKELADLDEAIEQTRSQLTGLVGAKQFCVHLMDTCDTPPESEESEGLTLDELQEQLGAESVEFVPVEEEKSE